MKKKKYIIIATILLFLLNFPAHFVFELIPSDIMAVFFPVNESFFQHIKMIYTTYFIFYFIIFIFRKRLEVKNVFTSNLVSSLSGIIFFTIIYLPIYYRFGEHMIVTFILLFISILVSQWLSSLILTKKDYKVLEILSLVILSIIFIINGYLTFHPLKTSSFYDSVNETYDIVAK